MRKGYDITRLFLCILLVACEAHMATGADIVHEEYSWGGIDVGVGNTIPYDVDALAFGLDNETGDLGALAFGNRNKAKGNSSNAFGDMNEVYGECSIGFGSGNNVPGFQSLAFGNCNSASGIFSVAFGAWNESEGVSDSAFGWENYTSGDCSNAFGFGNKARTYYSSAFGVNNSTLYSDDESDDSDYSNAFGYGNIAKSQYSSAFGVNNSTFGRNSSAFGFGNIAEGSDSSALGNSCFAIGEGSVAIGYQSVAAEDYVVSFGHSEGDPIPDILGGSFVEEQNSRLIHVASGSANTDAVNVGQLKAYQQKLDDTQLAAANSGITADKVAVYDNYSTFLTATGISAKNMKVTNVAAGSEETDAVNYGQFKTAFTEASFDSANNRYILRRENGETFEINAGSSSGIDPELAGKITQNSYDISDNRSNIIQNTADIITNKNNIAKNANEIENMKHIQSGLDFSSGAIPIGPGNELGESGNKAIAIGIDNKAKGKYSIAIGYSINGKNNEVIGDNSIAIGYGHKIKGNNSGAFGDPTTINTDNSYSVGNNNTINAANSFILGNNAATNGENSIVLGNGSTVSAKNGVAIGNNTEVLAANAVAIGEGSEAKKPDTVSVGSDSKKRRITNVAKAEDSTDAVNYEQMKNYVAANSGSSEDIFRLRSEINKLDGRISRVGASAGALAALKPMEFDPDNKWSAGIGFGNLNGKSAAAVGIFYRPSRDVYYTIGGNVGGEENVVNAGINFSFGHRSERSDVKHYTIVREGADFEAFCHENEALREKVVAQDTEIVGLRKTVVAQNKQIVCLENTVVDQQIKMNDMITRLNNMEQFVMQLSEANRRNGE